MRPGLILSHASIRPAGSRRFWGSASGATAMSVALSFTGLDHAFYTSIERGIASAFGSIACKGACTSIKLSWLWRTKSPESPGDHKPSGGALRAGQSRLRLRRHRNRLRGSRSDDETVDRHAVNPSPKAGSVPEQALWKRRARISSWPGRNSGPLARGRIIYNPPAP